METGLGGERSGFVRSPQQDQTWIYNHEGTVQQCPLIAKILYVRQDLCQIPGDPLCYYSSTPALSLCLRVYARSMNPARSPSFVGCISSFVRSFVRWCVSGSGVSVGLGAFFNTSEICWVMQVHAVMCPPEYSQVSFLISNGMQSEMCSQPEGVCAFRPNMPLCAAGRMRQELR